MRYQRASIADGVATAAMVGFGETYVPAVALAVGMDAVAAGLVATVPMVVGAIAQLFTPAALRRVGSFRRWVIGCAILQALSLGVLAGGAWSTSVSFVALVGLMAVYWGCSLSASSTWSSWITSLVPVAERAKFFAKRTSRAQLSLLLSLVAAGTLLAVGRRSGWAIVAFATVFALAFASRGASAVFLARHDEADGAREHIAAARMSTAWQDVKEGSSLPVLTYLVVMQVGVNVAAPYFTPFMLGPLSLTYDQFMALTGMAFLSRVFALPRLGELAESRGTKWVLWLGGAGIIPLPALWLISDNFWYLLGVQALSGVVWAALELATTLSFFEQIPDHHRVGVLSLFNLANSLAVAAGAVIGGILYRWAPPEYGFMLLFCLSSLSRLCALLLLRRTPATEASASGVQFRTLAVRPSAGAVERPVLPTLPPAEESGPGNGPETTGSVS